VDVNLYCAAGCRVPDPPYRACLADALRAGAVSESDLDQALRRALLPRFRLGLFDSDAPARTPWANATAGDVDTPAARAAAREAAAAGVVLLRNSGLLPLSGAGRVAVIGPNANRAAALVSDYNGCSDATGAPQVAAGWLWCGWFKWPAE
jgi:beta-glucosidase-like glycosyl hydrolase